QANQDHGGTTVKELITGLKAESKIPYLKELEARQQKYKERDPDASPITGIPTHFIDLDKMLNGFNNSNLMILAARPAMGKSAILSNLAVQLCVQNKIPVGMLPLEMRPAQVPHRMITAQSEVESEKILTGSLNGSEYQRVVQAVKMMEKHTIVIDDQPEL